MIQNQWYAILPSRHVKNHIVAVRRMNLDLALFRGPSGDIACVVDQCTHRGALSRGKIRKDAFSAPSMGFNLIQAANAC